MVSTKEKGTFHDRNGHTRFSFLTSIPSFLLLLKCIVAKYFTSALQIGLKGEALNLHSLTGSSSVEWMKGSLVARKQPLTWYKASFSAPGGNEPLVLDMSSMGKGHIWINGQSIGCYWPSYKASGNCGECSYSGTYNEKQCQTNCGDSSQRWYHVPRSWLNLTGNLLVVFKEWGGEPSGISLVKRTVGSVCADISEWHPTRKNWNIKATSRPEMLQRPKAHVRCDPGQKISSIKFSSFGASQGRCGNLQQGGCHSPNSYDVFQKEGVLQKCIGQQWCPVIASPGIFGGDLCPNIWKKLAVEAICS